MLTHGIMMAQTLAYFAEIEPVGPGDCVLHAAPMSHGSGCYGLPHVAMGAKTVVPESAGFEPEEIAELSAIHGNVSFFAAPTMVSRLINNSGFADADHCGLRTIIYGGAPMHFETLLRGLDLLGPKFAQIYGQGEVPMTITALSKGAARRPSRGRAGARSWARSACPAPTWRCASPTKTIAILPPAKSAKCWSVAKW